MQQKQMIVKEDLIMAGEKIFDRLKKITEQVTEKGKSALDKGMTQASFALEKSKLNSQIEGINKEIKKLNHSLGEAAYVQWENGSEDLKSLEGMFLAIQQKKEEIIELNKKIAEIEVQEQQLMESAAVTEEVSRVQESMEDNVEVQENTENNAESAGEVKAEFICPGCGVKYDTPAKFCKNCGTKMQ